MIRNERPPVSPIGLQEAFHPDRLALTMIIDVNLSLPLVNSIRGIWKVSDLERSASWEAYIEIITRISPSQQDISQRDVKRELSTLEDLLNKLRDILKKYGPLIGKTAGVNDLSFAHLALTVINVLLRPVLLKRMKIVNADVDNEDICKELDRVYAVLIDYCNILAQGADVAL